MTYALIIDILSTSIIGYFDEVYHSAEIVNLEKEKFPAVSIANEWINLSPSDQKKTIYIRRNGDDEVIGELGLGSCTKSYRVRSGLRIVFFKDHAKNHGEILSKLMQSVLVGGTKLNKITRDKWKLLKEESSGDYNFGATSAYFAIDIYALWDLQPDICEQDFCADLENPLKRESCPVVA